MEQKLGAILSDPASMSKIMELAKGLGLNPPGQPSQPDPPGLPAAEASGSAQHGPKPSLPDLQLPQAAALGSLFSAMGGQGPDDKQTALLKALRPYLRPERQDRLDKAIQTARMVKAAKQAMKQFSL